MNYYLLPIGNKMTTMRIVSLKYVKYYSRTTFIILTFLEKRIKF